MNHPDLLNWMWFKFDQAAAMRTQPALWKDLQRYHLERETREASQLTTTPSGHHSIATARGKFVWKFGGSPAQRKLRNIVLTLFWGQVNRRFFKIWWQVQRICNETSFMNTAASSCPLLGPHVILAPQGNTSQCWPCWAFSAVTKSSWIKRHHRCIWFSSAGF